MAIDYRYHLASIVAIFVSLLLGILVGIGLAPNPEELDQVVSDLRKQYDQTRNERAEELQQAQSKIDELTAVGKAAVAATIDGRLRGKRVAVVLNHEFPRGLPDDLRGLLAQAGADVTPTLTVTRRFVTLTEEGRRQVSRRLLFYPPSGTPFRAALSQAIARDLTTGQSRIIGTLQASDLLSTGPGWTFAGRPDAVVLLGGASKAGDILPEQIDVPLVAELQQLGVRVVGCEASTAGVSCIPYYKAQGIATVDDVDRLGGRLALVLAVAGAEGHFGTKDTADQLIPEVPAAGE